MELRRYPHVDCCFRFFCSLTKFSSFEGIGVPMKSKVISGFVRLIWLSLLSRNRSIDRSRICGTSR